MSKWTAEEVRTQITKETLRDNTSTFMGTVNMLAAYAERLEQDARKVSDAALPYESALAELIEAVDPSIDSGDIIVDAHAASLVAMKRREPVGEVISINPMEHIACVKYATGINGKWPFDIGAKLYTHPPAQAPSELNPNSAAAYRLGWSDAFAAQASESAVRGESGWLIEEWNSKRDELMCRWWALVDTPDSSGTWTKDSSIALRFSRKVDAEAYIAETGWTEAKATDHAWGITKGNPSEAPKVPERLEESPFYWRCGGGIKTDADTAYVCGWNDCRIAMIAASPTPATES